MTTPSPFLSDSNQPAPATPPPPSTPFPPTPEAPQVNRVPMTWLELWASALTSPKESTYEDIMADPKAKAGPYFPYLWIAISFLIAVIISVILRGIFGVAEFQWLYKLFQQYSGVASPFNNPGIAAPGYGASIFTTICCLPLIVILELLGFIIDVGLITLFAKILGGKGSFSELAFAFAAYTVPATIFATIIASIPIVNCLGIFIAIYLFILRCIAVKVVHKFSWARTLVVTLVFPLILAGILLAAFFGLVFATVSTFIQHNPSFFNGLNI